MEFVQAVTHADALKHGWTFWYRNGTTRYYRRGDRVMFVDGQSMGCFSVWAHVS